MNRVSTYIRQSLCDIYPPQELKSLTMMIWCDLLGMDALDIYLGKDINLSESKWSKIIESGLEACGYIKNQKITSVVDRKKAVSVNK